MALGQKLFGEVGKISGFKVAKVHPVEGVTTESYLVLFSLTNSLQLDMSGFVSPIIKKSLKQIHIIIHGSYR